jgi:capsular exopolysaccharide synthesis family protein
MKTQVTELAAELQTQQEKLHAFQSSNNVVFLQEQGNSAGNYLSLLSRRLANLRNELALLRSLEPEQWVEAKTGRATVPSIDPSADAAVAREMLTSLAGPQLELFKANQQMQLLKARRDELARHLKPQHPKIIKLNEDIQTQEQIVNISKSEAARQMALRRQAIELEVKNLEAASAEWDAKAIQASRRMADYERIRQDLQRVQATHDRMLGLIQTVDVSRSVEQDNVGILEPATPAAPRHRMLRNLAIALAGSLLLGFGLLYGLAMFHDDFSSLTEVSNHLSEEVVGQIPDISIRKPKIKFGAEVMEKQRFEFLESFRNIRASLLFMNNGSGAKPKTIVITSSVPEEGKSTVALYLAATLAMGNSRVLLVDADMRRGNLHKSLGAPASPGLAELLNREATPASPIVRTELENLSFLPAGEAKRNPGELVLSAEWKRFLSATREQFDFILVDTPPVLASNDAAALASNVDGALYVVRGSFTSARRARGGLEALRHCHIRVLGLIFNRAISSPYEYHCYQQYQDSYRWQPPANRAVNLVGSAVNGRSDE